MTPLYGIYYRDAEEQATMTLDDQPISMIDIDDICECLTLVTGTIMNDLCQMGLATVIDGRFAPRWGLIMDRLAEKPRKRRKA